MIQALDIQGLPLMIRLAARGRSSPDVEGPSGPSSWIARATKIICILGTRSKVLRSSLYLLSYWRQYSWARHLSRIPSVNYKFFCC
jgi:hypothetical protein